MRILAKSIIIAGNIKLIFSKMESLLLSYTGRKKLTSVRSGRYRGRHLSRGRKILDFAQQWDSIDLTKKNEFYINYRSQIFLMLCLFFTLNTMQMPLGPPKGIWAFLPQLPGTPVPGSWGKNVSRQTSCDFMRRIVKC